MASAIRWPDFVYVGAARAGSTWCYQILSEHPQIAMPHAKEIQYFDRNYDRGPAWYGRFFEHARPGQISGEVWHDYFLDSEVAARMRRDCPTVRIVAIVREPVARAASRLAWARAHELVGDVSLGEYALRPEIAREADYVANLTPYFDRFPREQVLVQLYDDLQADPATFAAALFRFLGVDATFAPPSLRRVVRPSGTARNAWIGHAAMQAGRALRSIGAASLVGQIKRSPLMQRALYRPSQSHEEQLAVPDEQAAAIRARFAPTYDALEALLGRRLPDSWRFDTR